MTENQRIEGFLKDLARISKEYGIYVDACSCCNSPWLCDGATRKILKSGLDWEGDKYEVSDEKYF